MHTLTEQERQAAIAALERSRDLLLEAGRGLTPAQFTWKPAPESWSVAETMEHVALVEGLFQGRLNRMSGSEALANASGETAERLAGREEFIEKAARSRENKRQAPPPALPQGAFTEFAAFEAHFASLRGQSIDFVRKTQAPLHGVFETHPALGDLTGHQWLCLMSAHSERHADQAREVRATAGFPQA